MAQMIPLSQAARRLRLSWAQAYRFVLLGTLRAEQQRNGRWLVAVDSVDALAEQLERQAGDGDEAGEGRLVAAG